MNELKDLKIELKEINSKLEFEMESFLNQVDMVSDPISLLTGEKARWIFMNPFLKTDLAMKKLVEAIAETIFSGSQEKFFVVSAHLNKKENELKLGFSNVAKGEPLVFWEIFSNKIDIPSWNLLIDERVERESLIELLREKEKLFHETSIIVNSQEALLNNGYFNLFLKSIVFRKKFKKEVTSLLDDLKEEILLTKRELELRKDRDLKIMENESILNCLDQLQLQFLRFPLLKSYSDYSKIKSTTK